MRKLRAGYRAPSVDRKGGSQGVGSNAWVPTHGPQLMGPRVYVLARMSQRVCSSTYVLDRGSQDVGPRVWVLDRGSQRVCPSMYVLARMF